VPVLQLAGRDGVAGGTWMGVNAVDGRWASLVNVAPPAGAVVDPTAPSRGILAERFIAAEPRLPPAQFARQQAADEAVGQMAGHSMLVGDAAGRVSYYCNRGGEPAERWRECGRGIFALSNDTATADRDSAWHKSKRGKQLMAEVLARGTSAAELEDALFEMLLDAGKEMAPAERHGFRPGGAREGEAFESYAAAHPERPE